MKMNPIFNLLRRTMFAALAATTIACGGDDPVVPQLPGGGNNGQDGTEEEKPEIKPDEGITLYGLVSDSEGNPLEGVVVSDGYSVVATDAKGVYQIVRSANAKYVFISAPSGYEIPTQANYGSYQGTYQAANSLTGSSTKPYRADFTLTKLSQSDTRFLLFGLGDPQPDNDEHIKRFRTETVPDVKKIKADYTIPTVGIALGDILGKGDAQTFTSMKRALGETGVPFFTTIGNHDKSSVDYTGDTYRDVLGPRWYSFNRGEVHFVAMDNCLFSGQDYTGGFTDEQVAWLEKDLSFVPTSKMIVLYYHIPLRDTNYRNRQKVLDLISKYQTPTLMCAHTHYFQPYHMRSHNLFERTTAVRAAISGARTAAATARPTASWSTRSTERRSSTPISRPRSVPTIIRYASITATPSSRGLTPPTNTIWGRTSSWPTSSPPAWTARRGKWSSPRTAAKRGAT